MTGDEATNPLRLEDRALLTGRASFVDDIHLDRMAHAVFVRSPVAHARIASINIQPALAAGACAVLVGSDLPFIEKRLAARYWHPSARKVLPTFLAVDVVRFVGEAVAMVLAESRYLAEDIAELVEIDYEPLEVSADAKQSLLAQPPSLHAEWPNNIAAEFRHIIGDAEAALRQSPNRIRRRFCFNRQGGMPLETRGCVADYDTANERLNIWTSTQTHYAVRANVADVLELPEQSVRVLTGDVGGGFGAKSRPYNEEVLVSYASRLVGRPVKWIEDRLEHMQATTQSRGIQTELELGYDSEGQISALSGRLVVDIGAYIFTSGIITAEVAAAHCCGPYKIPHVALDVFCIGTNKTPLATCRGAGQPEATFPLECLLDLIATERGLTAFELRRRNIVAPQDMPYDPSISYGGAKGIFESGDFPQLVRRAVQASGYHESVENGPGRERIAWGLACGIEGTGLINYETARIQIDASGVIHIHCGLSSQGQGQATALREVCVQAIGADPRYVKVTLGDTGLLGFGRGTFASRGAVMGGNATLGAAEKIRQTLLAGAGQLLQCAPESLRISKGQVLRSDGTATTLSLRDLAQAYQPNGPLFTGNVTALDETFVFDNKNTVTMAVSVHAAKVAVDERTGACKVLDYLVVHDAGRMLVPKIVEGQIVGGAAEGIGCALFSEFVHDDQGQLLTGSLSDYLLISAPETPRIRVDHLETHASTNPLGVRGVGEGGTIAAPPAIVNAVRRAINPESVELEEQLFRLPLRPDSVLRAMGQL
ncbi:MULTISPECIES: xanthine dehydrogenase family protein molybdopterin-binding subunit [Bradyrhizobium]|uniref:xanthine dehydrogenase family protein molybdopterin-binding subunit n=1 Tax=Bradyrhizobium TaxID=374 RepID=UPI0018C19F91|nr:MULTISPECIES: xanthine dehydrogenase family protein molybdopterin-binding subunit [Bradyrhizobium]QOZ19634.1 xanthine dehydrogenase family protein molybdopterin-binding subunit [Bradyrhizobium sp. CCBAU 21365]